MNSKVRIEDIARKIAIGPFGSRMKSDCYTSSGVPVIRGTNLSGGKTFSGEWVYISEETANELENCCVYSGDLVFPHRGSIGEVGIVTDAFPRYMMSSSLMKLSCDKTKADSTFIYYFFKSKQGRHELLKNASQVGTPGIGQPLTSLKNIEVPLPSIIEQRRIAKILGTLDDKIELNRQTNQTLEQIAQALFKSWFIDFEPTRAKIAAKEAGASPEEIERAAMCAISGKTPDQLTQLPQDTQQNLKTTTALFPDTLVDSELGEVPEGWEVGAVENHIDILNGHAFKSNDYAESGTFVLRTKNFNNGIVERLNDDAFLPNEFRQTHKQYLCEPFDYHLVMVGASIGNTGLIYPHLLPALRNQNMWCFKARSVSYSKQFFVKFMLDHIIKSSIGLASGSAREFFRKGDFGKQKICVGHKSIQETFHTLVKPLMQEQSTLDAQNQKLTLIRDTLLPRLLSNELAITELIEESA